MTKRVTIPDLPTTIQGDGRYVMHLLRRALTDTAEGVNAANGWTEEAATPTMPQDFRLTFDRMGAHFHWTASAHAEHYELRTNDAVGTADGLIARTSDTHYDGAPREWAGTVCLYAIAGGEASERAQLTYSKARPLRPEKVALTRTEDGTLITVSSIPADCLGVRFVIDGEVFLTESEIFLHRHDAERRIREVRAAYYDPFGSGAETVVTADVPTVEDFLVEKNGDTLTLSWQAVPAYGAQYVVKAAYREPNWDAAVTLFETALTRHRMTWPQAGEVWLMIKARDARGNLSHDAAYFHLTKAVNEHKNVIAVFDQAAGAYPGTMRGMYYDAQANGLRLAEGERFGEYIAAVKLPREYRARSYVDARLIGVTDDKLMWDDADFAWADTDAAKTVWNGASGDLGGAVLTREIAERTSLAAGTRDAWTLDRTLVTERGSEPTAAQAADDWQDARWSDGLRIGALTRLAYEVDAAPLFALSFWVKVYGGESGILLTLRTAGGALTLSYDAARQAFLLGGSDGREVLLPWKITDRDWLALAAEQTADERRLRLYSLMKQKHHSASTAAPPMGELTRAEAGLME